MSRVVAILGLMSLATQGCASPASNRDVENPRQRGQHLRWDDDPWAAAWVAARARLNAMCAAPTASCADKMIRANTSIRFDEWALDDWDLMRLPPYRTVVAVHEEELRKRQVPRVYEVYMLGVSHYLADKADRGAITDLQVVRAFNAAWKEMVNRTRADVVFGASAVDAAQRADAETWAKFRDAASTIGSVLGAAHGGTAARSSAPSLVVEPGHQVTCQADRNKIAGQSDELTVRCQ